MDPAILGRVALRALSAYLFLLVLLRLAGRGSIRHATPFDFVMALVLGDLVDNAIWAEVPSAQFAVASATLALARIALSRSYGLVTDPFAWSRAANRSTTRR